MARQKGIGPSDKELVESYQRDRDAAALEVLVGRYVECTRAMIRGIVLHESDVDDLTQQAFLHAMRGLSGFDRRSEFSTWLYRVALNTTRRFLKRQTRPAADAQTTRAERIAPAAEGPGRRALQGELHRDIVEALESLSPHLRAAIVLRVIEGLSTKEVAAIEGCGPDTIRWRVHQARKILKQRLARHLEP